MSIVCFGRYYAVPSRATVVVPLYLLLWYDVNKQRSLNKELCFLHIYKFYFFINKNFKIIRSEHDVNF